MIVVLGATGYMGSAFLEALEERSWPYRSLSRAELDYTSFEVLLQFLIENQPEFLINAAGFTGKPNVDACEIARAETLSGNVMLPLTIAHACAITGTPWGHISSGCSYNGAKVFRNGSWEIETDLSSPAFQMLRRKHPEQIRGFDESDELNFSFRRPPCSFYSGTKALAEESLGRLVGAGFRGYIWRLRLPFDERDSVRNYLTKLQRYPKVYDNTNSISHRGDFVRACLELWERRAPFGIYNMTNPGHITTREVVEMIQSRILSRLGVARKFEFWSGDDEFYRKGATTLRSNCILEVNKLLATGVRLRSVGDALQDALQRWQPEK
jgi:dTDP-4-dehydrorhamnose reductase